MTANTVERSRRTNEQVTASEGVEISRVGQHLVIGENKRRAMGGGGVRIMYAKVKEWGTGDYGYDYLVCDMWDMRNDVAITEDINVALPYALRISNYDGSSGYTVDGQTLTYESTVTGVGTVTETLFITPSYGANDFLRVFAAYTGVLDGDGNDVRYEDLNNSGRIWATGALSVVV